MNTSATTYGTVTASFADYDSANRFYESLINRGYTRDEITVIMSDETRKNLPDDMDVKEDANAAGTGAMVWGTVGWILGAILALGTNAIIPGLGIVVAGPVLGALVGGGAGWALGTLIGALTKAGVSEEQAKLYEQNIRNGDIVFVVSPKSMEDETDFNTMSRQYSRKDYYFYEYNK